MSRVVIVGAGISGLTIAFRLQQRAPLVDVVVLERGDRPGGTMWTLRQAGYQVEMGPNGFLDTKPSTLQLCNDLGISDQLLPASEAAGKNRYLFIDGRLQLLPGNLRALLKTRLLSWRGKINFFAERFRGTPRQEADESVASFARRRGGREIAATFADALVTGIFAGDPELLSLAACFPRLARFEREHGSVLKGFSRTAHQNRLDATKRGEVYRRPGTMWSFRAGLRVLIEALRDRLKNPPLLGVQVRTLARKRGNGPRRWQVQADGQDAWEADAVVLACPAYHQSQILGDLDPELADRIGQIQYNRLAVVALGFRRQSIPAPLDGFGYIAPQRCRRDLLGVQWCSSIFPARSPDGTVLLRAMCGGWHRPEIVDWDDAKLIQAVRADLKESMQVTAEPIFHEIIRWHRAIPQYHLGHLTRLEWIDQHATRHPGLFLAGNAYHGVAINDCTEQASLLAERIVAALGQSLLGRE